MAVGDIHLSRLKAKPTQILPGSFSSGVFHVPDGVKVPSIYPTSDSTNSVQIRKADNTTTVLGVDTTNTRVGVGGTPIYDFHIVRPSGTYQYSIIDSYNDETQGPTVGGRSARGNFTTPTATAIDDSILRITGSGYYTDDLASFTTSRARISFHAGENFTSTKHGTYISVFTTVIGTTTTSERMRITDVGSIGINTTMGTGALSNATIVSSNTAIGLNALSCISTTGANCAGLGASAAITGDNQVQLGDSATTTYVYGTVQTRASDERDKADIRDTVLGLDFICSLRPVDYKWDYREDYKPLMPENEEDKPAWLEAVKLANITHDGTHKRSRYHHGVIAQEVKAVIDDTGIDFGGYQDHSINGGDDCMTIGYSEFVAPLIKSIQELTLRNTLLEARIAVLEA